MYKLLLCWRYLHTRYIALASIISVMFGVWILIVVNSVMEGFTSEMQNRIHGIISDVVVESRNLNQGMPNAEWQIEQIRKTVGDDIEAITPTVVVPGMLSMQAGGQTMTRPVQLIGIDEKTQSLVSDFSKYLQHPENRKEMSFDLRPGGYDVRDHQGGDDAPERPTMEMAGWKYRIRLAEQLKFQEGYNHRDGGVQQAYVEDIKDPLGRDKSATAPEDLVEGPPAAPPPATNGPTNPIFNQFPEVIQSETPAFDMAKQQNTGVVLGIAMASMRVLKDKDNPNGGSEDRFWVLPGDDVKLTFPTAGMPPKIGSESFTIVDFYESKMSEYDSSFVFVPIRKLQQARGMIDPTTGIGNVNSIQIKLKPGVKGEDVRDKLQNVFAPELYAVETWRDKQGPLLAAVSMETAILNVLLFIIIIVAGFGILATFYMIVVEKTRDIGILKSLGAASKGVMGIFLSYGLLLGLVGSGGGLVLGLLTVRYINQIAKVLGWITGRPVFDPTIYYFYKIPTILDPQTIICVVLGAVSIAVAASILPAYYAAGLRPVEALRYE
jgi:lipoprotein-releasing system permease protein